MTQYAGSLYIVSAPSGAGKSSLVKALLAQDTGIGLSISHTTRAPRPGEEDGREYHFVSTETFLAMKAANGFLEHAHVHGNWYGTSKAWVASQMQQDRDVLLEIDWQGAKQVMGLVPEGVSIFILPPSMDELERRLRGRGTDSEEVIARRLDAAGQELAQAPGYDYLILNDDFKIALEELKCVVTASRCRFAQQRARHKQQFSNFNI